MEPDHSPRVVAPALAALLCLGGTSCSTQNAWSETALGGHLDNLLISTTSDQVGRLTSSGAGRMRTFNQYDALGRPTAVQHVLDGTSYVFQSAYGYPQGTLSGPGTVVTSNTFPDGETVTYSYDASGGGQSIRTTPAGGITQTVVYQILRNVRGQTYEVDFGNGAQQFHCYNDGRPCGSSNSPDGDLRLFRIYTTSNGTPQQYTYTFDPNGNITSVSDINGDATASYQYDSLDRLTGGTWSYGYDNLGNLTSKEGVAQTYFPSGTGSVHPHALASAGGLTYTYDANGNLTSRSDGLTVSWSADNMPIRVSGGAANTTTTKSFLGEKLWKKVQAGTTTYYLPSLRVENGLVRRYFGVFAERDPNDTVSCTVNAGKGCLKFYHGDHIGSSTLVTDANGMVVRRASYKPYGEDRVTPVASFTPRYQFTFKEKEQDGTGFYDYGARLYNPATGRWLSADSMTTDGLNRYAYVSNNPLRYSDPTGHFQDDHEKHEDQYQQIKKAQKIRRQDERAAKKAFKNREDGPAPRGRSGKIDSIEKSKQRADRAARQAQAEEAATTEAEASQATAGGRTGTSSASTAEAEAAESAASRSALRTGRTLGRKLGPAVGLGVLTVDGVRVAHAATTGNPNDPAFNDAAGHGGGVLGGIGFGALAGSWCGPWCALGGGIIGAFVGEAGMRKLQRELTTPVSSPAVDERARRMTEACGSSFCK